MDGLRMSPLDILKQLMGVGGRTADVMGPQEQWQRDILDGRIPSDYTFDQWRQWKLQQVHGQDNQPMTNDPMNNGFGGGLRY